MYLLIKRLFGFAGTCFTFVLFLFNSLSFPLFPLLSHPSSGQQLSSLSISAPPPLCYGFEILGTSSYHLSLHVSVCILFSVTASYLLCPKHPLITTCTSVSKRQKFLYHLLSCKISVCFLFSHLHSQMLTR